MTDQILNHDILAAIDFLEKLHGADRRHLCSIKPDGGITSRTFDSNDLAGIERYLSNKINSENLYFHVNPLRDDVQNKKSKKDHVLHAITAHVDIDDLDGLNRLQSFDLLPTAVIFSGNGYHEYWVFAEPVSDTGRVEEINSWLVQELDADPEATDVSRILRLPGTINLPNKKKRDKDRKPVVAKLVSELTDWNRTYSPTEFGIPRNATSTDRKNSSSSSVSATDESKIEPLGLPEKLSTRLWSAPMKVVRYLR